MIASSRRDLVRSESAFADGLSQWFRGEDSVNAVAAGQVFAETFLWWRMIMGQKIEQR